MQTTFQKIITQFPAVHALVNNAGIAIFKPAEEVSFEDWTAVLGTNLNGTFLCSQACFPAFLTAKGCIVNIASISGLRASTLRMAYGTSKAAIMHLTKQQAVEYGNKGVRANAIAPGPVETEMAKLVHSADIRTSYADAIPHGMVRWKKWRMQFIFYAAPLRLISTVKYSRLMGGLMGRAWVYRV